MGCTGQVIGECATLARAMLRIDEECVHSFQMSMNPVELSPLPLLVKRTLDESSGLIAFGPVLSHPAIYGQTDNCCSSSMQYRMCCCQVMGCMY